MNQSNLNLQNKTVGTVDCLGETFSNEDARREHYLKLLAQKLKDPKFRKIEGFPIGKDEDILAFSDPPYYTACPNPWLGDFIKHYGTPFDPKQPYHREPFAADVSEGKNHPIYNAHSYHTKVPHRAIMRYLLHYTQPGDMVFDGFCGTGMTGVAAQLCGDRAEVQALGYRIQEDGTVLNEDGKPFSKLGARRAILNDLSPAATFIASNYNTTVDAEAFEREAKRILKEVEDELGWMFQTKHSDGRGKGSINFVIWSDVFICPHCAQEFVFWEVAADPVAGEVKDEFKCSHCRSLLEKRMVERAWSTSLDTSLNATVRQPKQVPVVICYSVDGKRFEKKPGPEDLALITKVEKVDVKDWFPTVQIPKGDKTGEPLRIGITHTHQFYSHRNLAVLASFWSKICRAKASIPHLGLWFTSTHAWTTRMNRLLTSNYFKKRGGVIGQTLQGTLYLSSIGIETSAIERFRLRLKSVPFTAWGGVSYVTTGSATALTIPSSSVDYLFIDPPFGSNIMYSELNILWESWIKIRTSTATEAIENRTQGKTLDDYRVLMVKAFSEAYRVLKPGRWITVEFSNTQASVWNAIQTALSEAGFVVANVSALEKTHKGFNAVTTTTAVKQDLVISAYKPNGGLEERFAKRGETEEGAWDFVRTHLNNLPVVKAKGGQMELIAERDPRILYDRMVAFYVGHTTPVPLSSAEFQVSLAEKFPERDGMFFLPEQVNEYDKKRAQIESIGQLAIFVEDERSAINWLRGFLKDRPSTYQDIQPEFMQQLSASWKKWEARPELSALLDQSFLCYDGTGEVPSQIHSYLSTQFKDLRNLPKDHVQLNAKAKNRWFVPDPKNLIQVEQQRNKKLLEEFWTYLPDGYTPPVLTAKAGQMLPGLAAPRPKIPKGKKLKELRTEAVRVGFKHCYQQKDYQTILVVAEMLPESVLNEDEQLQMLYDTAVTRSGAGE
jgi:DNA modification methylase